MQQSVMNLRQFLESLHWRMGQTLVIGSRTLAAIVALGAFFCLMMLGGLSMMRHPEQVFHTRLFQMNYAELKPETNSETHQQTSPKTGKNQALPSTSDEVGLDPDWDGALAGFGVGYEVGQSIPVVGSIVGPMLGAVVGYQLDKQI